MKEQIILLLFVAQFAMGQSVVRFSRNEYFNISVSVDPNGSLNEKGIDFVGEMEYCGPIYIKAGLENFSALYGGYTDAHWGAGLSLNAGIFDQFRIYSGFRSAIVWRGGEGAYRVNYGLESGVDYFVSENIFCGLRATMDKRYDQEIFGWSPEIKFSGFFRVGFKWNYKH